MNSEEKNKNKDSKEITIKEGQGGYGGHHKVVERNDQKDDKSNSNNEEE